MSNFSSLLLLHFPIIVIIIIIDTATHAKLCQPFNPPRVCRAGADEGVAAAALALGHALSHSICRCAIHRLTDCQVTVKSFSSKLGWRPKLFGARCVAFILVMLLLLLPHPLLVPPPRQTKLFSLDKDERASDQTSNAVKDFPLLVNFVPLRRLLLLFIVILVASLKVSSSKSKCGNGPKFYGLI